eukprot:4038037-Pyramimonas_sp.AAC.1
MDIKSFVTDGKDPDPTSVTGTVGRTVVTTVSTGVSDDITDRFDLERTNNVLDKKALRIRFMLYLKENDRKAAWDINTAIQNLVDSGTLS